MPHWIVRVQKHAMCTWQKSLKLEGNSEPPRYQCAMEEVWRDGLCDTLRFCKPWEVFSAVPGNSREVA
ncbi:hypothetical protein HAX54_051635 [Datura stramonium]|uniref:Uncharacterized protein n=1 Tax=Datura stramonium TaxID=4076 RepID=A0ABS8WRM2_DATST|nr:hypothetical protein [Datura stramonium]